MDLFFNNMNVDDLKKIDKNGDIKLVVVINDFNKVNQFLSVYDKNKNTELLKEHLNNHKNNNNKTILEILIDKKVDIKIIELLTQKGLKLDVEILNYPPNYNINNNNIDIKDEHIYDKTYADMKNYFNIIDKKFNKKIKLPCKNFDFDRLDELLIHSLQQNQNNIPEILQLRRHNAIDQPVAPLLRPLRHNDIEQFDDLNLPPSLQRMDSFIMDDNEFLPQLQLNRTNANNNQIINNLASRGPPPGFTHRINENPNNNQLGGTKFKTDILGYAILSNCDKITFKYLLKNIKININESQFDYIKYIYENNKNDYIKLYVKNLYKQQINEKILTDLFTYNSSSSSIYDAIEKNNISNNTIEKVLYNTHTKYITNLNKKNLNLKKIIENINYTDEFDIVFNYLLFINYEIIPSKKAIKYILMKYNDLMTSDLFYKFIAIFTGYSKPVEIVFNYDFLSIFDKNMKFINFIKYEKINNDISKTQNMINQFIKQIEQHKNKNIDIINNKNLYNYFENDKIDEINNYIELCETKYGDIENMKSNIKLYENKINKYTELKSKYPNNNKNIKMINSINKKIRKYKYLTTTLNEIIQIINVLQPLKRLQEKIIQQNRLFDIQTNQDLIKFQENLIIYIDKEEFSELHNLIQSYKNNTEVDIELTKEVTLNKINSIIDKANLNYKINNMIHDYNQFNVIYNEKKQLLYDKKFIMKFIKNNKNVGADAGGLTRAFNNDIANILIKDYFVLKKSIYYDIDETLFNHVNDFNKLNKNEKYEIIKNKINFIGVLFGISLLNKYIIPIKLHPFIYYQLIKNNFNKLSYDEYCKIITNFSDDEKLLKEFTGEIYDTNQIIINNTVYDLTFNSNEHKKFIVDLTTKKYKNNIFQGLINGFREIINIKSSFLYLMDIKLFSKLLSGSEITLNKFIKQMQVEYMGKLIDINHNVTVGLIKLIKNHNDKINTETNSDDNIYLKELLKFMTGVSNLEGDDKLFFYVKSSMSELSVHTCGKSMELSIYHIFPETYPEIIELNKLPGNEEVLKDWYIKLDVLKYENIKNIAINAL